jgi:glycosyltransferase involved in cell wall biosynthesis
VRVHLYARDFPLAGERFEGGLVKAVHGLAVGFVANGIDVTVLCNGAQEASRQTSAGYAIRCFRRAPAAPLGLTLSGGFDRYLDNCNGCDIFVLNGVFNPDTYALSRACRRRRIPYFSWPHDPYDRPLFANRGYVKWPYWYLRDRPMLQTANAIQVFDVKHSERLRELGVNTPTIEIPNGVDALDVLPESQLQWRASGPVKLIFLGRIDYYNKALDILLDSFAEVARNQEMRLTLQGPDDGDLETLRGRAARLGLAEDLLEFKAPRFDRKASEILVEHDVFVLPSRFEGFALAALEAMVAGRVLMVSEINGIAKHVRAAGCGVVVRPDVESVQLGLLQLMAVRSRWKEMGMAGREYALANFRWDHIAAELLKEYSRSVTPER